MPSNFVPAGLLCLMIATEVVAQSRGTIVLDGAFIVSSESRDIELFDVVCNKSLGTHALRGKALKTIADVCVSDAGYIEVRYRNITNNSDWTNSSLMKPGDSIKP